MVDFKTIAFLMVWNVVLILIGFYMGRKTKMLPMPAPKEKTLKSGTYTEDDGNDPYHDALYSSDEDERIETIK